MTMLNKYVLNDNDVEKVSGGIQLLPIKICPEPIPFPFPPSCVDPVPGPVPGPVILPI